MEVFICGIIFVPHAFFTALMVLLWSVYGLTYTARPPYWMYERRVLMAPEAIIVWLCVVVAHV
jgi:hypothetical protein